MKLSGLKRVPPPPPAPERKICVACKTFAAECIVPVGEASAPMCWVCAHHVVEHECPPHEAGTAECECSPHEIYPHRAVMRLPHGDLTYKQMQEGAKRGHTAHQYNANTGCIDTWYAGELVDSAPILPVAENAPRRKPS